ncbi:FixH family protein [Zunongwangia endophytica]|uniref:FixH family protein n=1 Tax=Zunongwangia endophytica TaxID=1808945 RepID=A0ABV8H831_9FLAO|nr:FixH family protein [Zunongwangia endophytica]MDN3593705.1 FixH family protein [Zunongwangia endophytica]
MKFNWGTGLVIGMCCFVSFILFFVIKMSTDTKYEYDLVVEDYYGKELHFQQEIDAEKNLNLFSEAITGNKTTDGYTLYFPQTSEEIEGNIHLYRPSNKKLDFTIPLKLNEGKIVIPDDQLVAGRWDISVEMTYQEKEILFKKSITY